MKKRIRLSGSINKNMIGYSKFVNLDLNGEKTKPLLTATINPWGINKKDLGKKLKFFAEIKDKTNYLDISIKCKKVGTKGMAGYPSIIFGQSPWWPSSDIVLNKLKDYKKIKITTKWNFKGNGFTNFMYNVWLDKKEKGKLNENNVEMMIILDGAFDPPWKELESSKNFKVKYRRKGKDYHRAGHTFVFFPKTRKKSFDLIELTDYCKNKIKGVNEYYLRSIELGSEFTANTEVKVKIYNVNFDFRKVLR